VHDGSPEWFLANHHCYDNFKADDPKVFLGEYASWGNTYYNALVEAAFMTGLQNYAYAVGLACYAPMLCNVDYINWKPDLIWFNNREVYGTANYYVQKLFMNHQGDQLLEIKANGFTSPKERQIEAITGAISLGVDASAARFSEIQLIYNATGEVKTYSDLSEEISNLPNPAQNRTAKRILELGATEWESYTLSLKATRTVGRKGFVFYFGKAMIRIICIGS
jgi:alpha-L-arabinofuranosidase